MKKRVLYASADYEEVIRENGYFVDKTSYIPKLETVKNPVFLHPRRFGKSLWCRIPECYYNINQKDGYSDIHISEKILLISEILYFYRTTFFEKTRFRFPDAPRA